jgi:nitrite reductase (cytochrome c-552)
MGLVVAVVAAVAAGGIAALLINIFQRKQESRNPFFRVVELTNETEDPAVWGKNFPYQYDGYKRTVDMAELDSRARPSRTPTGAIRGHRYRSGSGTIRA